MIKPGKAKKEKKNSLKKKKHKERILKAEREKWLTIYKGTTMTLTADLSSIQKWNEEKNPFTVTLKIIK